ncbi:hypothetical protein [Halosimplex halobium]|uniref:hypothetical protein n=1 Tax=Halosimplex halobium TaxID=3396618 RepID=UPI003F56EDAE
MTFRRRQQFVSATLAWMLAATLVLVLLDALTMDLFVSVSLIGFFVVTELTAPRAVTPTWRRRIYVIGALGLILFAYIVIKRILAILPAGVI